MLERIAESRQPEITALKEEVERLKRAIVLLKATEDILKECNKTSYVKDVFEQTAMWDNAECDGFCLLEDITCFLDEAQLKGDKEG